MERLFDRPARRVLADCRRAMEANRKASSDGSINASDRIESPERSAGDARRSGSYASREELAGGSELNGGSGDHGSALPVYDGTDQTDAGGVQLIADAPNEVYADAEAVCQFTELADLGFDGAVGQFILEPSDGKSQVSVGDYASASKSGEDRGALLGNRKGIPQAFNRSIVGKDAVQQPFQLIDMRDQFLAARRVNVDARDFQSGGSPRPLDAGAGSRVVPFPAPAVRRYGG